MHDQLAVARSDQRKLGEQLEVLVVAGADGGAQQFAIARSDGGRHREDPAMTLVEVLEDGLPHVVAGAVDAVGGGHAGDGRPAPAAGDHLEVGAVDGGQLLQFGGRQGQLPLADVEDLATGAQRGEALHGAARRQHEVHGRRSFGDELGEQPASFRRRRDVVGIVDHDADAEWPAPGQLAEQRARADRRRAVAGACIDGLVECFGETAEEGAGEPSLPEQATTSSAPRGARRFSALSWASSTDLPNPGPATSVTTRRRPSFPGQLEQSRPQQQAAVGHSVPSSVPPPLYACRPGWFSCT